MEDSHLFVRILFIQPFSSLRDKVFPLRSRPFSVFLVSCFPRSIRSHLCRQVIDLTLVGTVIHFLPEGPAFDAFLLSHRFRKPLSMSFPSATLSAAKCRKALNDFVQARCLDPPSPSLDDRCAMRHHSFAERCPAEA